MQRQQLGKTGEAIWIDITNPSEAELDLLGQEYALDSSHLHDCLQPEHLPKFEMAEKSEFLILRAYDSTCNWQADTTQELTRKIAIFRSAGALITIHRLPNPILEKIYAKWSGKNLSTDTLNVILYDIFLGSLTSFDPSIDEALNRIEEIEKSLFQVPGSKPFNLQEAYVVKRRSFIFRRLFRSTFDVFQKINFGKSVKASMVQNLRDELDSSMFYTEEITESATVLLNLHVSLSSQRTNEASQQTNEVVRVLTIFSVFLLPLNVVTGIYGMNFKYMPELEWPHGYPMALGIMAAVVIATFFWFRSHGYLRGGFQIDGFKRDQSKQP